MKKWIGFSIVVLIGFVLSAQSIEPDHTQPLGFSYQAVERDKVWQIFPVPGDRSIVRKVPADLYGIFSKDGRRLYKTKSTLEMMPLPGLFTVALETMKETLVLGTSNFIDIDSLSDTARGDKLFLSGAQLDADESTSCGLFAVSLVTGRMERVLPQESPSCQDETIWRDVSVSPQGDKLLAWQQRNIKLIDIQSRVIVTVGSGLYPTLSPDGKQGAYVAEGYAWVFDVNAPSQQRKLGKVGGGKMVWSPDSRFLLFAKLGLPCEPFFHTLKLLSVPDGKVTSIASSRCQVMTSGYDWISDQLLSKVAM